VHTRKAQSLSPDKCFPNRIDEVNVLTDAMKMNPEDFKAPYYLGNFWYAYRRYEEATVCWEKSVEINNQFPTALRNLSLAYYTKKAGKKKHADCWRKHLNWTKRTHASLWSWINYRN